jgi:hypothetical protein
VDNLERIALLGKGHAGPGSDGSRTQHRTASLEQATAGQPEATFEFVSHLVPP